MKMTLVCVSGITTSILANKLNAYAKEQEYDDYFVATRLSMSLETILTSDIVLIAPQAKPTSTRLKEEAEKLGVPLVFLEEEELVFGKVEQIYQEIEKYRNKQEMVLEKIHLTTKKLLIIYCNAFLRCFPLLLLGLLLILFFLLMHQSIQTIIFGVFPFYLSFAIGYEYGNMMKQSKLFMGLLFLASSAFILQINHIHSITTVLLGLRSGFIPLIKINLVNYMIIILISFITIVATAIIQSLFFKRSYRKSQVVHNLLEMPLINSIVFVILLIGRMLLF